jgi:hypothetical protein
MIFQPEVVKQRLRTGVLPHHKQMSSEYGQPQQHGETMPRSTSLSHTDFVKICQLVPTFSTGTPVINI